MYTIYDKFFVIIVHSLGVKELANPAIINSTSCGAVIKQFSAIQLKVPIIRDAFLGIFVYDMTTMNPNALQFMFTKAGALAGLAVFFCIRVIFIKFCIFLSLYEEMK